MNVHGNIQRVYEMPINLFKLNAINVRATMSLHKTTKSSENLAVYMGGAIIINILRMASCVKYLLENNRDHTLEKFARNSTPKAIWKQHLNPISLSSNCSTIDSLFAKEKSWTFFCASKAIDASAPYGDVQIKLPLLLQQRNVFFLFLWIFIDDSKSVAICECW